MAEIIMMKRLWRPSVRLFSSTRLKPVEDADMILRELTSKLQESFGLQIHQEKGSVVFLRGNDDAFYQKAGLFSTVSLPDSTQALVLAVASTQVIALRMPEEFHYRPSKPPLLRQATREQLFTGHLRIDMCQPMTVGNFIVLKGRPTSGKQQAIAGAIDRFLEDPNSHVVHVSLLPRKDIPQHERLT